MRWSTLISGISKASTIQLLVLPIKNHSQLNQLEEAKAKERYQKTIKTRRYLPPNLRTEGPQSCSLEKQLSIPKDTIGSRPKHPLTESKAK